LRALDGGGDVLARRANAHSRGGRFGSGFGSGFGGWCWSGFRGGFGGRFGSGFGGWCWSGFWGGCWGSGGGYWPGWYPKLALHNIEKEKKQRKKKRKKRFYQFTAPAVRAIASKKAAPWSLFEAPVKRNKIIHNF
jgi:hypothetical protein